MGLKDFVPVMVFGVSLATGGTIACARAPLPPSVWEEVPRQRRMVAVDKATKGAALNAVGRCFGTSVGSWRLRRAVWADAVVDRGPPDWWFVRLGAAVWSVRVTREGAPGDYRATPDNAALAYEAEVAGP